MENLKKLYENPISSDRTGPLSNAFAYPTKISPEAIAIFIACHTDIGASILDPFGGSGTTGIAALLCDQPTTKMLKTVETIGLKPKWGKRTAYIYEISTL